MFQQKTIMFDIMGKIAEKKYLPEALIDLKDIIQRIV